MHVQLDSPANQPQNLIQAYTLDLLSPTVSARGDYYFVDFGAGILPRRHYVPHLESGLKCLCDLGRDCPSIAYTQSFGAQVHTGAQPERAKAFCPPTTMHAYLEQLFEENPDLVKIHPDRFELRFIPQTCPECGGRTYADHRFNSKLTGESGWGCENSGMRCFLRRKHRRLAASLIEQARKNPDPWVIPPVKGYPGIRASDMICYRAQVNAFDPKTAQEDALPLGEVTFTSSGAALLR